MNNAVIHFEEINEARDIGELLAPLLPLFDEELGVEIILRNCTAQINADEEKTQKSIQFIEDLLPSTTTSLPSTHKPCTTVIKQCAMEKIAPFKNLLKFAFQ